MEFLKISLITFMFFYFSLFNFLEILLFREIFFYYKNNKNILLKKINYCNILFFYSITFYEISCYYILIGYKKFKNNYIGRYIHASLEMVNTKYLQLKDYLINKLFNIVIHLVIMIMLKKKQKNKKSNKKFNFNKFLDNLENK